MEPTEGGRSDAAWRLTSEFVPRLNNQLTVPIGLLDLLLTDPDLPPALRRQLETVLAGLEAVTAEIARMQRAARATLPEAHPEATDTARTAFAQSAAGRLERFRQSG